MALRSLHRSCCPIACVTGSRSVYACISQHISHHPCQRLPLPPSMSPCHHHHTMLQVNSEIVSIQRISTNAGEAQLRELMEEHVRLTGSPRARNMLDDWQGTLEHIWQIVPPSEANTPQTSPIAEAQAESGNEGVSKEQHRLEEEVLAQREQNRELVTAR